MTTFVTVKEAAQLTGRSTSSIRRIIYPIIHDNQHPDRQHVQPSAKEALALRMKGENFAWRVSQELLDRQAPPKPAADPSQKPAASGGGDSPSLRELVELLREQLQRSHEQLLVKDQQIATLSEITKSLNERLHEGNILIGTWQRQLPVPSAPEQSATDANATPSPRPKPAARSAPKAPATKPSKQIEKKPTKKGILARLFR